MGSTGVSAIDWLRVAGSIVLVLLLLAALLWTLRRMKTLQSSQGGERKLHVIETISVGPRQKIALLQVANHQVLIGMSATQFTALGSWEAPVAPKGNDLEI
ncbi:MAG: flagellar biosynthetic protein FliO [Burkholderiaceae bacterium]